MAGRPYYTKWIEKKLLDGLLTVVGLFLGLLITRGLPVIGGAVGVLFQLLGGLLSALFQAFLDTVERLVVLAERLTGRSLRHSRLATTLATGAVVSFVVVPGVAVVLVSLGTLVELASIALLESAAALAVLGVSFAVGAAGGLLWALATPQPARGTPAAQAVPADAPDTGAWQQAFAHGDASRPSVPWEDVFSRNGAGPARAPSLWEQTFTNGHPSDEDEEFWERAADGFVIGEEMETPWW